MRKILFYYSVGVTLALIICGVVVRHTTIENSRLRNNQEALTSKVNHYRTRYDASVASVQSLQLRLDEFRETHARDVEQIRALGLKLRRVESSAKSAVTTSLDVRTTLRDTILQHDTLGLLLCDTVQMFRWSDAWVSIEGEICGRSVNCHIESIDTLRQVVHRVPRRFLGIPYGTKAIRQEITSSNPHTTIVYSEYIDLRRRRR